MDPKTRMCSRVDFPEDYSWREESVFGQQLAFNADQKWWLANQNISDGIIELYDAGWGYTTPFFWSPNGSFLWGTNGCGDFIRLAVRPAGSVDVAIVTPEAWKASGPKRAVWHAQWNDIEGHLYCFIGRGFAVYPLELWVIPNGAGAELLAANTKWLVQCVDVMPKNDDLFTIWADVDSGIARICIGDRNGTTVTIHQLGDKERPQFINRSPSGDFCLFSTRGNRDLLSPFSLYAIDLRTGDQWKLGNYLLASWSPDGSRVAAVLSDQQLVVIDWKSRRIETRIEVTSASALPADRTHSYAMSPTWSSDSKLIAFNLCFSGPQSRDETFSEEFGSPATFVVDLNEKWISPLATCTTLCSWRPPQG